MDNEQKSYTLADLIREEHILTGVNAPDSEGAISEISRRLVKTGYVEAEFEQDVWKREGEFPTGLPTEPIGVAIPHADPDHVIKTAVCIGILDRPVTFAQMGTDSSKEVDARVIFMLAIKEKEKQVVMIQQLVQLIQNPGLLEELVGAKEPAQALKLVKQSLAAD